MARNTTPKGKIVRRFGINIFGQPKYDKILKKKPHGPGKSAKYRSRGKSSNYLLQLIEKQKFRFCYGISEKQYRNIYRQAKKSGGITGNKMIELLESRIDNIVYRLGWAITRSQARQLVSHKHFLLNGIPHNAPSALLSPGDTITVKNPAVKDLIRKNLAVPRIQASSWIESDSDNITGRLKALPRTEDIQPVGNIQMVVEYYSRQ